ncbi:MAG: tRNA 2-thiouridine(34) synthase MnmA [Candidatus Pacebacteria bacterium]|nr:tRNA 2-thiouridine(34) synthase MnmA [Candidatus Paceibacterota bacterium]
MENKNKLKNKSTYQRGRKVFVGMSGGVDSSVTAVLLKNQGYDVTGVFIKVWQPDFIECQWKEDRLDAMRVCAFLEIPFLDLDLEKEYKQGVFDYMIDEYKKGRTPNPDVMCNKKIKFGAFLDFALQNGVDYIATGHYVRLNDLVIKLPSAEKSLGNQVTKWELLAGVDKNKDQSYFLWTLTQKQLKHCLFPIGEFEKPEVRKIAKKFNLINAQKKDSQGLCFVGKVDMKEFLERFIPHKIGDVLNSVGEKIGEHDGIHYYTLGQRHGFRILEKGTDDNPYYVVAKDLEKNTLIVSHDFQIKNGSAPSATIEGGQGNDKNLLEIEDINWILEKEPDLNKKYSARIRYRQTLQNCVLERKDDPKSEIGQEKVFVNFEKEQKTASSGQSIVIYDKDICLGGGVIK